MGNLLTKFLKGTVLAALAQVVAALIAALGSVHPSGSAAQQYIVAAIISVVAGLLHALARQLGIGPDK